MIEVKDFFFGRNEHEKSGNYIIILDWCIFFVCRRIGVGAGALDAANSGTARNHVCSSYLIYTVINFIYPRFFTYKVTRFMTITWYCNIKTNFYVMDRFNPLIKYSSCVVCRADWHYRNQARFHQYFQRIDGCRWSDILDNTSYIEILSSESSVRKTIERNRNKNIWIYIYMNTNLSAFKYRL